MSRPVISVQHVAKRYLRPRSGHKGSLRRPRDLFDREEHWALHDVSFDIADGESVGLIGVNGSGKSTLLRLLSGLTRPTSGRVDLHKQVSGLLTLGDSFQGEMSAAENALTGVILAGLTRRQALERLDAVAEFAELESVMDQPLRTFSDGMRLRLAFAISVNVDPEVLLIDEILAVGDLRFRHKCLSRLEQLKADGVTVIISSHELEQIEQLCERTLWLSEGRIRGDGPSKQVTEDYSMAMQERLGSMTDERDGFTRIGDGAVQISSVRINGHLGRSYVPRLMPGQALHVEIGYVAHRDIGAAIVGVSAHNADGDVKLFDVSTAHAGVDVRLAAGTGSVNLVLDRLDAQPAEYSLDVGIYQKDWEHPYDYHFAAYPFEVRGHASGGQLNPPHQWSWA